MPLALNFNSEAALCIAGYVTGRTKQRSQFQLQPNKVIDFCSAGCASTVILFPGWVIYFPLHCSVSPIGHRASNVVTIRNHSCKMHASCIEHMILISGRRWEEEARFIHLQDPLSRLPSLSKQCLNESEGDVGDACRPGNCSKQNYIKVVVEKPGSSLVLARLPEQKRERLRPESTFNPPPFFLN